MVGSDVFTIKDNTVEINAHKQDHPKFDTVSGLSALEHVLTAAVIKGYEKLQGAW